MFVSFSVKIDSRFLNPGGKKQSNSSCFHLTEMHSLQPTHSEPCICFEWLAIGLFQTRMAEPLKHDCELPASVLRSFTARLLTSSPWASPVDHARCFLWAVQTASHAFSQLARLCLPPLQPSPTRVVQTQQSLANAR